MISIYFILILIAHVTHGAKILGFFYIPSVSHQNVFQPIWKELSLRGHQVTVIAPNPIGDPELSNLTEIDVSVGYEIFKHHDYTNVRRDLMSIYEIYRIFVDTTLDAIKLETATEEVQQILKLPEDYFDLILIEAHSSVLYGLQHKFKAPLIAISSLDVSSTLHHSMGNPTHPFLFPDFMSGYVNGEMSLMDKLDSLRITVGFWLLDEFIYLPKEDALARKYFGNDMPYITEFMKSTSLLFLNVNPVFSDRRPYAPNVIQYTVAKKGNNNFLSKDLQKILDDAKDGAIYFSLGTNVRFDHVQENFKQTVIEALGELPYTVLCKWESEDFPGKPKNVILRKWFSQNSVLAHPNIKLFVTQGGLQSSEEAIANGVPLVVIPFLGDQPMNAKILTKNGIAETIYPSEVTKDVLKNAILKVTKDESYRVKARELQSILLDQPQMGVDKIVWWCEYVIRHKGASHLRSPGGDISLYEYFMLDIFLVILVMLFAAYKALSLVLKFVIKLLSHSEPKTVSKKKRN